MNIDIRGSCSLRRSDASKSTDGTISASLLGFQRPLNAAPAFWSVSITIDGSPDGGEFVWHGTTHGDVTFVASDYLAIGNLNFNPAIGEL